MSEKIDLEIPIALIFIGGGLLIKGLINFRKSRKIQDTARIDISSAPQGLVELEGYSWPLETPLSAVCGRQVVYYHYKVQKLVKRNKSSSWETQYQFNHNASFYVIDQSGVCILNPDQDCMDLTEKITKLFGYGETIEQLKNLYSAKPGFLAQMFSGNYRLVEKKLFVGSPVYVCGNMQAMNLNQVKIRGDYKKFLTHVRTMSSNPIFKMNKLDINRDGKLSDEEFIEGFAEASKESSQLGIEHEAKITGTVSASEAHKLIVADGHQEQYLKRLTSFNLLKIWGGVAMIGAGLYFLLFLPA